MSAFNSLRACVSANRAFMSIAAGAAQRTAGCLGLAACIELLAAFHLHLAPFVACILYSGSPELAPLAADCLLQA